MATDAVHFLVDELVAAPFVAVTVLGALYLADHGVLGTVAQTVRSQPAAWRWLESLVGAEVAGYWGHRLQHGLPVLWRFHRLHHSSPVMDWLAPNRRHPVDLIGSRLVVAVPLLLIGFSVPTVAAHFIIRRSQGLFVHANLRVTMGPLRWFVAGPAFHHWHHAEERAASACNFAGEVPLVDWLFGTLYLPDRSWPLAYGIGEEAPDGYVAQLLWPFLTNRRRQAVSKPAVAAERRICAHTRASARYTTGSGRRVATHHLSHVSARPVNRPATIGTPLLQSRL